VRLNQHMEMLNLAMRASRKEMKGLGKDAAGMHQALKTFAEDDPVRNLTAAHARYALGVRPGVLNRMFARFRD